MLKNNFKFLAVMEMGVASLEGIEAPPLTEHVILHKPITPQGIPPIYRSHVNVKF